MFIEIASMASPKMSLKLLVDKKGQRVILAEAPKEFVDFLFHLFSLPLGTVVQILGSKEMVGSLGKLKESIDSLNGTYLQPGIKKDDIFNPKTPFKGNQFLLQSHDSSSVDQSVASKVIYRCHNASVGCSSSWCYTINASCRSNATLHSNSICTGCSKSMNYGMTVITPKEVAATEESIEKKTKVGFVKEVVTYMVMDDLIVKPMSTISSITFINKYGVKDLSQLEEKIVSFGKDEALKLFKASMTTDQVLTTLYFNTIFSPKTSKRTKRSRKN